MDEVDIENLTIEQYLRLTQENQIPKKVDDMTIAEYLEYEETMKTQDYDEYQPHSTKADVLTTYRDHLSPHHKSPDPSLDTKTNPYLQASQSPVHPKITKTMSKYAREIKEQSNQGLDLGASVNIMSESMLDELSLADPKHANIIVEMADKTRCVSQGIVENVLVKIDKFSFTSDFVIIDTKELNSKTIILGRPFLANIRAEINISTREVSLGIKEDRVKIKMKEQECNTAVGEHLNKRPTSQAELSHGAVNKTHWCEPVCQEHEKGYTLWASCDPYHEICDGGGIPDKKLKHYWKSTNDNDRINLEWEGLSCTNWVRARYGNVNDITKERILQKFWDNKLGGQIREKILTEEQEDPEKCGDTKERAIIRAIVNNYLKMVIRGLAKIRKTWKVSLM
ncbi:RNA-directed DNA polymerase, eukaryota, reverse transcriptase zinc-binding domain protein [Tanacetum coccineum]